MKRLFCILSVLFILFAVCSCNNQAPDWDALDSTEDDDTPSVCPEDSDKPDFSDQDYISSVCTKDSVDEFISITGIIHGDGLLSGLSITEENLYNVTPSEVSKATDVKIFKASGMCASFILIDGKVYEICQSFGGYGFVNAVPCDFDGDGNVELLVASSWGSGLHRSIISVFDIETKKSTVIHDTSDTDHPEIDLIVATAPPSSNDSSDLPISYQVYSVDVKIDDYNSAALSYAPIEMIGTVEYENGAVVFKPTAEYANSYPSTEDESGAIAIEPAS